MTRFILVAALCILTSVATGQDLLIDFNSLTQDGGPHPQDGYQSYDAGHEVPDDFDSKEYAAFGTEVILTPSWPDSSDARTMQMIDRTATHDAFWMGDKADLLTDWIGVDTRVSNGGNGDFTFDEGGEPTRIDLTLSGVPAGTYNWISYHHDTEWIHTEFFAEISVDGGNNFDLVLNSNGDETFEMTASNDTGGNPPAEEHYQGDDDADPILLPSTLIFEFDKPNETDDLVMRFTPLSQVAVHTQLVGINGFELYRFDDPPGGEGGDFDNNGTYDCADIDLLYSGLGGADTTYDLNQDGAVDADDVVAWRAEAGTELGFAGPIPAGDVDLSGVVDAGDLNQVGLNWQVAATSWCAGDLNHDGTVDASDLNALGVSWQSDVRPAAAASAAAVPEPTSVGMMLLAFTGLACCRRRRP